MITDGCDKAWMICFRGKDGLIPVPHTGSFHEDGAWVSLMDYPDDCVTAQQIRAAKEPDGFCCVRMALSTIESTLPKTTPLTAEPVQYTLPIGDSANGGHENGKEEKEVEHCA